MKKRMLLVCGMILAGTVFGGEFVQDYQSAIKLYNGGKYTEAEEAFVKLSEEKTSARGIDESLAYAAYSAEQQKKSDKAIEFAEKIKDKSLNAFCRMKLMEKQRKWDEMLVLTKDEDFEKWPDALIYSASFCRGSAYVETRNAENAKKDFLIAAKNTVDQVNKAYVYQALGNMYFSISKDTQKALDAYGEVVKLMTEAKKPSLARGLLQGALTSRARIFASQENGAEAVSDIEKLSRFEVKEPYVLCEIQLWNGQIYEIIGKNTEALESYRKASAIEKVPVDMVTEANQRIADLEKKLRK